MRYKGFSTIERIAGFIPAILFVLLFYALPLFDSFRWQMTPDANPRIITLSSVALALLFAHYIFKLLSGRLPVKIDLVLLLGGGLLLYSVINLYVKDKLGRHTDLVLFRSYLLLTWFYFFSRSDRPDKAIALVLYNISFAAYGNICIGLFQLIKYKNPFAVTGMFSNPGHYAAFLLVCLPVTIYWLAGSRRPQLRSGMIVRSLALLALLASVGLLVYVSSRASLLAIALTLPVLGIKTGFWQRITRRMSLPQRWTGLLILIAVFLAACVYLYGAKPGSSTGRRLIYTVSLGMVADHPLTGVGSDEFKAGYDLYQARYFKQPRPSGEVLVADNDNFAFNEYLQFTIEEGALGWLFALPILLLLVKKGIICPQGRETFLFLPFLVFLLTNCCFFYALHILPVMGTCIFFAGIMPGGRTITLRHHKSWVLILLLSAVVLTGSQTVWYWRKFRAYETWTDVLQHVYTSPEKERIYKELYVSLSNDGYFLFNYGTFLLQEQDFGHALSMFEQSRQYVEADYTNSYIGDLLWKKGDLVSAEKYYLLAADMVPNRLQTKFKLMRLALDGGKRKEALFWAGAIIKAPLKVESFTGMQIKEAARKVLATGETDR